MSSSVSDSVAETSASATPPTITLTERAARRITEVAAHQGQDGEFLRVSVTGGGCQGFSYHFSFDQQLREDDRIFEKAAARLVIDEVSLDLLAGSEIDFIEDLMGQYFKVNNPNAVSSCGCGTSFSI